jgi:hypothetical protein
MFKSSAFSLLFFLLSYFSVSAQQKESEFIGTYGDTICFRANECCISKLKIKEDHTYLLVMVGYNHGHKNKSTYKGTWKVENDFITLTPDKNKKNLKEEQKATTYKIHQKNLLFENARLYLPENIAYKKNK